ncbi:MAG: DUF4912 domain-containing protein [Deltaproteobacteria bacterium]|nr:DUF4912 domain-containing protein [Deltaproteobacteria bacterium]
MTRVPSDRPVKLEAIAVAERLAGTVRRQLLAVAQASLRMVRELLAQLPDDGPARATRSAAGEPVATAAPAAAAPTPSAPTPAADLLRASGRLPASYGSDRLVLLARDPHCLYAYWDVSRDRDEAVRAEAAGGQLRLVLRTYDVTRIAFDGEPPRRFQDFAVGGIARSLYAYVGTPAACFVAEVGYLRPDGAFFPLARSLPAWTPRTDQPGTAPGRWMTVGWSERRGAGEVVPGDATAGPAPTPAEARPAPVAPSETPPTNVVRAAPSSWTGTAPSAAQRGSWSLVRGGLASPTTVDAPPAIRSQR